MADLTAAAAKRLARMWDAFERAGMLMTATVNATQTVRVEWRRQDAALGEVVLAPGLSIAAQESEWTAPTRGDLVEIDATEYRVISVDGDGFGRWVLGLERT